MEIDRTMMVYVHDADRAQTVESTEETSDNPEVRTDIPSDTHGVHGKFAHIAFHSCT